MTTKTQYYIIDCDLGVQPRNSLQKAIIQEMKVYHRDTIPANYFSEFEESIKLKIAELNAQFPRCTPETARDFQIDDTADICIDFGTTPFCSLCFSFFTL